jgi:uncharacterized membrane protein
MNIKIKNSRLNFVECHQLPERSFYYKGKQFPICSRCTGIYLGYLSLFLFLLGYKINYPIAMLLITPMFIDGLTQAFLNRESTNFIRLITGFIGGVGLMSIGTNIGEFTGQVVLNLLNI